VFAAVDPLAAWIRARPRLSALLERSGDRVATLSEKDRNTEWRDHAIIVGYGRVGEIIGDGLKAQGFPFIVVEEDRRRVEELRKQGVTAIYGDATAAGVLEAAGISRARLLVLAIPQGFQKRRIIELARQANPHIETAVRTHRASEVAYLKDQGVGIAIMGTREVAFGLLRYALSRFGLPDDRVQAIVQTARASGAGGAFEREPDNAAPELRERGDDHERS
jgi:CPA2 family monovalent cation:H+ antiporter-2